MLFASAEPERCETHTLVAQSPLSLLQVSLVSEWFSAVSGGTMCFAIGPSHKLSGHKLTQIVFVKRFFFFQ